MVKREDDYRMQFKFHIPVKAYFGTGCLAQNSRDLAEFGRKAFIVTGGHSALESGALTDLCNELKALNIEYTVFDEVENNPSLETVKAGGMAARKAGADFIAGIGGGSPLDASKAVAVLAVNDMEPLELYQNNFAVKPLPIVAIPTTAGTGSEMTQYSILTRDDLQTKVSFGNADTFPRVAFLDPRYTESQPYEVTVNTAVDAFSHCLEGYLGKRRTPASDILAQEGIGLFGKCLGSLKTGRFRYEDRENLLYMSMLGGMVIAHTGTTIVHGAGYNLTYFKGIPHGKANGYLIPGYLKYNYDYAKDRIENVLALLNMQSIDEFGAAMAELLGGFPSLDEEEIAQYAAITMKQRSTATNIRPVAASDIAALYRGL
jgi:alcohol dehydrogenase class IV